MKILLSPDYFYPEIFSSSYIFDDRNIAFAEAGFDIICNVPYPTRGVTKAIRRTYSSPSPEYMYDGKMKVVRFPLFGEGKNSLLRAIRYVLASSIQFIKGLQSDIDIIFMGSTPPFQGAMGGLLKTLKNKPLVFAIQDIFPDSLVGTGMAKQDGLLWKIGSAISNYAYRKADKIIVISQDFKRNLIEKGVPENKIELVYNWVDENAVIPIEKEENLLFEEFGISRDKFHVVYAGNLGNAQNIDVIIDAANALKDNNNIEFLIFGTGGLKDKYVAKVKELNIANVKFFPLQPMERVSQVYGLGDVCVVSCKPGLGGAAMPSKMLSIMSAGRAVVASFDKGELTYILENYKCGMYAPAGDASAFAELIMHLSQNREECKVMGDNARKLILQKFTKAYGTSRYVEIIKSVVSSRKLNAKNLSTDNTNLDNRQN